MIRKRDEIRAELLEHEAGLLSALQLPNDLDEGERPHGGEPMSRLKSPDQWSTECKSNLALALSTPALVIE